MSHLRPGASALLTLIIFLQQAVLYCPGFKKMGYFGDYYQQNGATTNCVVVCDKNLGYYASECGTDLKGEISYRTIYIRKGNDQYKPRFQGTNADLCCRYGCLSSESLGTEPYYFEITKEFFASVKPVRISHVIIKCKSGYFSKNDLDDPDGSDLKIALVCNRNHTSKEDNWAWNSRKNMKIECARGCTPFYLRYPVHQNGYGTLVACNFLGALEGTTTQLVSGCEAKCDTLNGYFPVLESSLYQLCEKDSNDQNFNFICDRGCISNEYITQQFRGLHNIEISCKHPFHNKWYDRCTAQCSNGFVPFSKGRMEEIDIVYCREGAFNINSLKLRCVRQCDIHRHCNIWSEKCQGTNQFGQNFCYHKKITITPEVEEED